MQSIQICGLLFMIGSTLLASRAQAALQQPLDTPAAGLLEGQSIGGGEDKNKDADCGQKPKLEAAQPDAADLAAKNRAVVGLVQLGHLPADKVEAPLEKTAQLAPKAMETCK